MVGNAPRRLCVAAAVAAALALSLPLAAQDLPDRRAATRAAEPEEPVDLAAIERLLDDPLFSDTPLPECDPERRACFRLRFELLITPELRREGFFEPPPLQRLALEREIYRQLLMDETPLTCESIGGIGSVAARRTELPLLHVVPVREAYRSGLTRQELPAFAADPANLTIALRAQAEARRDRDVHGFLPERNPCWYGWQQVLVKLRWSLRIDPLEADVLAALFEQCRVDRLLRPTCLDSDEQEDAEVHAAIGPLSR